MRGAPAWCSNREAGAVLVAIKAPPKAAQTRRTSTPRLQGPAPHRSLSRVRPCELRSVYGSDHGPITSFRFPTASYLSGTPDAGSASCALEHRRTLER